MFDRIRSSTPGSADITPGRVAIGGFVIVLLSLLLDIPGLAIVIASLVIPAAILVELPKRDAYENEPRWSSPAMVLWGIAVGIVAGVIASFVASEWWIDGAALHAGASGFGGAAAKSAGRPGAGVILVNGVVIAAAGVAFAAFGPYLLRRYPVFRNEVMDGVTLGAAAGAGLATGTAIVAVMPLLGDDGARGGSVADWTAMLLGLLVTRPVIFGLAVSFVCAGLWHVTLSQRSVDLAIPLGAGLGGAIVFWIGDLLVQPSGTRVELIWHVIVTAAMAGAGRLIVARAISHDREAAGLTGGRVVCPNCRSVTPAGAFCAKCGYTLSGASAVVAAAETLDGEQEVIDVAPADAETTPIELPGSSTPAS